MDRAEQIEALKSLLERVKAAEKADRQLDRDICMALLPAQKERGYSAWFGMQPKGSTKDPSAYWVYNAFVATVQIDAAFAVARRVLPEWDADLHRSKGGFCIVSMTGPEFCDADMRQYAESGVRPNGGLAICEALLSAKLALLTQEESNGR